MDACHIDDADNTVAARHAHVLAYTVPCSLVDRDEVVGAVERAGHDLRLYQAELRQEAVLAAVQIGGVLRRVVKPGGQFLHLLLQLEVAPGQFFVHLAHRQIGGHPGSCVIRQPGDIVR